MKAMHLNISIASFWEKCEKALSQIVNTGLLPEMKMAGIVFSNN